MCWRRRAWMPIAAMWPCHDTAMAWSCIMAATILPIRTASPEPCRVTGPRTWPRTTSSAIRRKAMPEQVKELLEARKVFEEVRPYGSHDAEAAYKKNPEFVREAAGGRVNRAIRALQLETELRTDPSRRADRFVEHWQKLDQASLRQYQAGDMSGYRASRSAMGDMAKSLARDPQLESVLASRKRELGIAFESGRRLGQELAFTHGIELGRGAGVGV